MNPSDVLRSLHDNLQPALDEEVVVLRTVTDAVEEAASDELETVKASANEDDDFDEDLDDEAKKIKKKKIKNGKVVKLTPQQIRNQKKPRGGQSIKQAIASQRNIKKAAKKANSPAAKRKRAKSMRKAKQLGLDSVEMLDINVLNDAIQNAIGDAAAERFIMDETEQATFIDILIDGVSIEFSDDNLVLEFPELQTDGHTLNFDEADFAEVTFKLSDGASVEDVVAYIMDEDGFDLMARMF